MDNLVLFRIEVLLFFTSFWYILYFISDKLYNTFFSLRNLIKPVKNDWQTNLSKLKVKAIDEVVKEDLNKKSKLSESEKEKIKTIIKKVKNLISKPDLVSARNLIIEWLSIDKDNKELNMDLAFIYQKNNEFKKAEYIYIDLNEKYKNDLDILEKLAFVLALQKNYNDSLRLYEKVFMKNKSNLDVIDIITNITYEIKDYTKCVKYTKIFLREKPRNVEKLTMIWMCLQELDRNDEALLYYKKILEIQPYNSVIIEKVREIG